MPSNSGCAYGRGLRETLEGRWSSEAIMSLISPNCILYGRPSDSGDTSDTYLNLQPCSKTALDVFPQGCLSSHYPL